MSRSIAQLKLFALLCGLAVIVALIGCAHKPAPLPTAQVRVATAQATVKTEHAAVTTEHAAARQSIATVTKAPTLPRALLPPLKDADTHIVSAEAHNQAADKALSDAIAANAETSKQVSDLAKERDELAAKVKAYDNGWLGGKAHRLIHWLIAGAILAVLAYVTLSIIAVSHPGVGGVEHVLLSIGTIGLHSLLAIPAALHTLWSKRAAATPAPAK